MSSRSASLALLLAILIAALAPSHAHAYLDPASGSIILQAILGGLAGLGLLVKLYWHKLLDLLGRDKPQDDASDV